MQAVHVWLWWLSDANYSFWHALFQPYKITADWFWFTSRWRLHPLWYFQSPPMRCLVHSYASPTQLNLKEWLEMCVAVLFVILPTLDKEEGNRDEFSPDSFDANIFRCCARRCICWAGFGMTNGFPVLAGLQSVWLRLCAPQVQLQCHTITLFCLI